MVWSITGANLTWLKQASQRGQIDWMAAQPAGYQVSVEFKTQGPIDAITVLSWGPQRWPVAEGSSQANQRSATAPFAARAARSELVHYAAERLNISSA